MHNDIQEMRAFAKADMIFTIVNQCDCELDEYGRSELLKRINAAYEGNEDFGQRMLLAIEDFLRKEMDSPQKHPFLTKLVKCDEMPNVVAKLSDYGLHVVVTNQFDDEGVITDYFIVQAKCTQPQWDNAMARTPMWFPVTLA